MHPPFYIPDTRVSQDIAHHTESKPMIRRGAVGTVLQILPFGTGPPVHPALRDYVDDTSPSLPTGRPAPARPVLHVVPPQRNGLRDTVGRFLIRIGQRMILENKPG